MPKFFMVTNGTVLNQSLIETIKEYEIKLTISLDGPAYINDQLRIDKNNQGTYNKVCKNIEELCKNNIEPTMIETTYTNIHEANNLSRTELSDFIRNDLSVPIVYMADCSGDKFAPKVIKKNDEANLVTRINNIMLNNNPTHLDNSILSLISGVIKQMYNKKISNNLHCTAGYNMISVLGNGDYYPCHRFVENNSYKIGNILNLDEQLKIKNILEKNDLDECKGCWANQFCNGCTWELMQNKEKELLLCKERKTVIKHIILTFINLDDDGKKNLNNNINRATISKRTPSV